MKKTLLAILLLAVAAGCDKYYADSEYDPAYYKTSTDFLTLRNFSADTTYWYIPDRKSAENPPQELSEWQKISIYAVPPKSSRILTFDSNDSYVTPEETYLPDDRICIYVAKSAVVRENKWSEIIQKNLWSGFRRYSVDDIVALKQIVTYPFPEL